MAVVKGSPAEASGTIDMAVQARPAVTRYAVAATCASAKYGTLSRVDLWPLTGRKHQLRKHMAYSGTPMLGDDKYRGPRAVQPPGGDGSAPLASASQRQAAEGGSSDDDDDSDAEEEDGDDGKDMHEQMTSLQHQGADGGSTPPRGDVLGDGTRVGLCLWAVGIQFTHPATGQAMSFDIVPRVESMYTELMSREGQVVLSP